MKKFPHERQKNFLARQVAARLIGVKYPPGTIVKSPTEGYGIVEFVSNGSPLPYFIRCENGAQITFSESGIDNHCISRTRYKESVRKRRKAGMKVNSLI